LSSVTTGIRGPKVSPVDGEPHGRSEIVGPLDAMPGVRANQDVMAGMKIERIGVAFDP
jgi:hypothetical protein